MSDVELARRSRTGPVAGLDPGRSKCGLVRTDASCLAILEAGVLPPELCFERIREWSRKGLVNSLVLGDGTGSTTWASRLRGMLPLHTVDEQHSTLDARRRYWEVEPAQGWRMLVPEGLRQPPRDWDDVVAQLLVERWLGHRLTRLPSR